MGNRQSTPKNERQGRTPEKQEGGSEKRGDSVDSTCSNKSVEHGHHIAYVGTVVREFYTRDGISSGIYAKLEKLCPVQPDWRPHYRS